jgi:hypothetical protein
MSHCFVLYSTFSSLDSTGVGIFGVFVSKPEVGNPIDWQRLVFETPASRSLSTASGDDES